MKTVIKCKFEVEIAVEGSIALNFDEIIHGPYGMHGRLRKEMFDAVQYEADETPGCYARAMESSVVFDVLELAERRRE